MLLMCTLYSYEGRDRYFYFPLQAESRTYVLKSDILGLIDRFSDIKNLVSFERALFEDYIFKNRIKIFQLFMSISPH